MINQPPKYLIDSSILIPYIRQNQSIVTRLDALPGKFVSPTIVAELAYGAHRSHAPHEGITKVTATLAALPVVVLDQAIALDFAELKSALVSTNQLIPDNDMWIAVTAMAYGITLIARDGHFSRIVPYGLSCQLW